MVTLNNTEAVLNVGQEFPIPSYTYNSERGVFQEVVRVYIQANWRDPQKVTPQVNAWQGMSSNWLLNQRLVSAMVIRLSVAPTIPIICDSQSKTQVSLKDGYTMGIGGLITASYQP